MPLDTCPVCDDLYDVDGFEEHGVETLYYCTCGVIFDKYGKIVPAACVDVQGLKEGSGFFINASRRRKEC